MDNIWHQLLGFYVGGFVVTLWSLIPIVRAGAVPVWRCVVSSFLWPIYVALDLLIRLVGRG